MDAIDESPVMDIRSVYRGFLTQKPIMQQEWVADLIKNYW